MNTPDTHNRMYMYLNTKRKTDLSLYLMFSEQLACCFLQAPFIKVHESKDSDVVSSNFCDVSIGLFLSANRNCTRHYYVLVEPSLFYF